MYVLHGLTLQTCSVSCYYLQWFRKGISIWSFCYAERGRLEKGVCIHRSIVSTYINDHKRSGWRVKAKLVSHCLIQTNTPLCCFRKQNNLVLETLRLRTLAESVLETTSHCLQIFHTTSSLTTTTRTLQCPVVYAHTTPTLATVSHLRIGIATRSTSTLLNVVGTTTTSSANSVCLRMSFTKRRSTLSLQNSYKRLPQNFHKKPFFQIQEIRNSVKIVFVNLPCSNLEYSNTLNIPEDPDVQWFIIKTTEQISSIWTSKPPISLFTISLNWLSYCNSIWGKSSKHETKLIFLNSNECE